MDLLKSNTTDRLNDARSHVHDVNVESNSKLYKIIQENEIQVQFNSPSGNKQTWSRLRNYC